MRWSWVVILLSISAILCVGSQKGVAREVSGGHFKATMSTKVQERKRPGVSEASKAKIDRFHPCKSKKIDLCNFFNLVDRNSTEDDKRMVPTGPNPLHNR
ncbi:hypothetical protein QJS04_geneDACA004055 [Acorus gramineus]|uniref:Uncharacterized protein n=1 Tax=Acorus gramineus TaxID=55184 RepID=A0AAV9BIW6_ACOGR|nr:hypothetical protein QJS04_geneDACA004055 [Acorus gramineus]